MNEQKIAALLKELVTANAGCWPTKRCENAQRLLEPEVGRLWYIFELAAGSWPNDVEEWCDHVLNKKDDSEFFGGNETL